MSNEILSQDEVDTLLKGVPAGATDGGSADGVRPYDLAAQEQIVGGRLQALELVDARFMRELRNNLFELLRRMAEVTVAPVRVVKFAEFVTKLALPTNLNIVQVKPLHGSALIVFEPALVSLVVDKLFGGPGRLRSGGEARDFSKTEQRIIQRLLKIVLAGYQEAWHELYPLTFEYQRTETHPQFAAIVAATEIVVVETFNIDLGTGAGAFQICIPYSTLEPIRDRLERPQAPVPFTPDPQWERMLAQQVQAAEVELTADLVNMQLTVRELLHIKVGDVLSVDIAPVIPASVDGVRMFECTYGALNGQYAVRIDRVLARQDHHVAGA